MADELVAKMDREIIRKGIEDGLITKAELWEEEAFNSEPSVKQTLIKCLSKLNRKGDRLALLFLLASSQNERKWKKNQNAERE